MRCILRSKERLVDNEKNPVYLTLLSTDNLRHGRDCGEFLCRAHARFLKCHSSHFVRELVKKRLLHLSSHTGSTYLVHGRLVQFQMNGSRYAFMYLFPRFRWCPRLATAAPSTRRPCGWVELYYQRARFATVISDIMVVSYFQYYQRLDDSVADVSYEVPEFQYFRFGLHERHVLCKVGSLSVRTKSTMEVTWQTFIKSYLTVSGNN